MKSELSEVVTTSREKIILSAGYLFGEKGYDGVSVRDIANAANVNSALIGYYFRGKEGLLTEVYTRHCEPLKRERIRLLTDQTEGGTPPCLEGILKAFIGPSVQAGQGSAEGRSFSRLRAILSAENCILLEKLVAQNFDESNRAFIDALAVCLPALNKEDVYWRFHFLLGAIYYTATGPHRIRALSDGKCDPSCPEDTTEQLINFAAAGFRAEPIRRQTHCQAPSIGSNPMQRPQIQRRRKSLDIFTC